MRDNGKVDKILSGFVVYTHCGGASIANRYCARESHAPILSLAECVRRTMVLYVVGRLHCTYAVRHGTEYKLVEPVPAGRFIVFFCLLSRGHFTLE